MRTLKCEYIIEFEITESPCSRMRPLEDIRETAAEELQKLLTDELETRVSVKEVSTKIEETSHE